MQAWQATVQDEQGNVVVNPSLTVYEADGVTLASIFDETGAPRANPFIGSLEGFVQFFAEPGDYKVVGASGAEFTQVWNVTLWGKGLPITPQKFGAVGDGVTDDTAAMQAWASYTDAMRDEGPNTFLVPPGRYLLTDTVSFRRATGSGFQCDFRFDGAEFVCDFNRSLSRMALFDFGDGSNPSERQVQYRILGRFKLSRGPNCTYAPVAVRCWGTGQTFIKSMDLSSWDNSGLELHGVQNFSVYDLTLFSGGHHFGYRDATASRYRRTGTTLNRVSGTFQFQASDVGKTISLRGGARSYTAVIQSISSPTSCVLNAEAAFNDTVDRTMRFGSAAPRTTASSATITIDGDEPLEGKVGLRVAIPRAGENGKTFFATVISENPGTRTLTLDKPVPVTLNPVANPLTQTTEIGVGALAIYSDIDVYGAGISQLRFYNLHIEEFRGVAITVDDAEKVHFFGVKMEGLLNHSSGHRTSYGAIWANRLAGTFVGELGGMYLGQYHFRFADQAQTFNFIDLNYRSDQNQMLMRVGPMLANSESAAVLFGNVCAVDVHPNAKFSDLVHDSNSPYPGYYPPQSFIDPTKDQSQFHVGNGVWANPAGDLNVGSVAIGGTSPLQRYNGAGAFLVSLTGNNPAVQCTGDFYGGYERIGNFAILNLRFLNIDTTGVAGGQPLTVRDLPFAVRGGLQFGNTGIVLASNVNASGPIIAFLDRDTQIIQFYEHQTGAAPRQIIVSDLTSGTASLRFSMTFITA